MRRIPRIRLAFVVFLAVITVALVVVYQEEIAALSDSGRVLTDPAPTHAAMQTAAATAREPNAFAMDMWRTGLLPQRRFAVALVRDRAGSIAGGWEALRPIVLSASATRDTQMATDALATLGRFGDRTAVAWSGRGLRDPDPRLARAWVDYLAVLRAKDRAAEMATVIEIVDSELAARIVVVLAEWTGEAWSLAPDAEPQDRKAIAGRITRWLDEHQDDEAFAPSGAGSPQPADASTPALEMSLVDTTGERIELGPASGHPRLVHFFSVRTPEYEREFATIAALTEGGDGSLKVVHINTDLAAATYAYEPGWRPPTTAIDADLPEGLDIGARSLGEPMPRDEIEAVLAALATRHHVAAPIVIDTDGDIARAYAAQAQPAFVLIDTTGFVVRRFDGARPLRVLARMVEDIAPGITPPTPLPEPLDPLDPLNPVNPAVPGIPAPPLPAPGL